MKQALIDTDILSYFFSRHAQVVENVDEYTDVFDQLNFSILTYYEILSGLNHRDARQQLSIFQRFVGENNVIPLTTQTIIIAADIYAETRRIGTPVDDLDILIASTAIENDWVLITHNRKHFEKIAGLEIEDWAEEI